LRSSRDQSKKNWSNKSRKKKKRRKKRKKRRRKNQKKEEISTKKREGGSKGFYLKAGEKEVYLIIKVTTECAGILCRKEEW